MWMKRPVEKGDYIMNSDEVELWDTFGLFQSLLDKYTDHIKKARRIHSSRPEVQFEIAVAFVGFKFAVPGEPWSEVQARFIYERTEGDLALENLSLYEAGADAIRAFACLALGAMLAKFSAEQLTEPQFVIGDAHLVGFTAMHSEAIENAFRAA